MTTLKRIVSSTAIVCVWLIILPTSGGSSIPQFGLLFLYSYLVIWCSQLASQMRWKVQFDDSKIASWAGRPNSTLEVVMGISKIAGTFFSSFLLRSSNTFFLILALTGIGATALELLIAKRGCLRRTTRWDEIRTLEFRNRMGKRYCLAKTDCDIVVLKDPNAIQRVIRHVEDRE